jgi:hypothetical protein
MKPSRRSCTPPTLLTSTSSRPCCSTAWSTSRAGAFGIDQIDGEGLDAFEAVQGRHGARPGDDVRALGGELVGHGQADALARPGDHRDLAGQLQVHARTLQVDAGIPAEEVDPPSSRARRLVATASPSSADP